VGKLALMVCVIIFASSSLTGAAAYEEPHVAGEQNRDRFGFIKDVH